MKTSVQLPKHKFFAMVETLSIKDGCGVTHENTFIFHGVGIFLLRFARKNLEETNAAVRIRNHVATSTISEKAVAFLFSAKFQLCEDVLQVELHNSFRLTSRFYPDSRRRLRLFFSIPTVCIVLFILFKTLFHLYPQGVKLS